MAPLESAKKAAATYAASLILEGQKVGLGTGSTAEYFIEALGTRCQKGLKITALASSKKTHELAQKAKIPLLDLSHLDVTVDGADEIDPQKRMIKGGGGALLQEKILARMSREMIVIVDETKLVSRLGNCNLPVEIIPFGEKATIEQINNLGFSGSLRLTPSGKPFVTDSGHHLFDIDPSAIHFNPSEDHLRLLQIPGVVETGFFLDYASRVIIGFLDGEVVIQ